jgi:hypothetical protein
MTAAAPLLEQAAHAETLAERLGLLSRIALEAVTEQDTEAVLQVLTEQEALREELEPLTRRLLEARTRGLAAGALEQSLRRLTEHLVHAQDTGRRVQEQLQEAHALLARQRETVHARSAVLVSYQKIDAPVSRGFTRTT